MIITAFHSHLSNDAGVAAIAGGIFPHHIPQNSTFPAITYELDSDEDYQTLGGISGMSSALFDVNCWDLVLITAHQLADAVESALVNYRGDLGGISPAVTVNHLRKDRGRFEFFETDTKLYRVSMRFFVAYED